VRVELLDALIGIVRVESSPSDEVEQQRQPAHGIHFALHVCKIRIIDDPIQDNRLALDRAARPPPPEHESARVNLETDIVLRARLHRDRKPAGVVRHPFRQLVEFRLTVDRTSSHDQYRRAGDGLVETIAHDAARDRGGAAESLLRHAMSTQPRIVELRDVLISSVRRQHTDEERQHDEASEAKAKIIHGFELDDTRPPPGTEKRVLDETVHLLFRLATTRAFVRGGSCSRARIRPNGEVSSVTERRTTR
jgi:hypothetical protein